MASNQPDPNDSSEGVGRRVTSAIVHRARAFHEAGHTDQEDCVFGGEGNGGIIDPRIHYCRDSLRAMCLILEGLVRWGGPISAWIEQTFQPSAVVKTAVECPAARVQPVLLALRDAYAGEEVDETEDIRVTWPDGSWMHARPSNTEPIIRVVAEADTREQAQAHSSRALAIIEEA